MMCGYESYVSNRGSYNGKMNLIHEPSGPLSLQLASPFPNQQFVDQTFSVRMHLVDGHGQIVRRFVGLINHIGMLEISDILVQTQNSCQD